MKQLFFSLFLCIALLNASEVVAQSKARVAQTVAQLTAQSARITYPIDRMVFQRTGAGGTAGKGTANIQLAGQYTNGWESLGDWKYRITNLDPNTGNSLGTVVTNATAGTNTASTITPTPSPSVGWLALPSDNTSLPFNRFYIDSNVLPSLANLSAGWYRVEVAFHQTMTLGGQVHHIYSVASSIKFGIGDIYFFSGQSNSRGFEDNGDDKLIGYYNGTAISTLPDAVSVINAYSGWADYGQNIKGYSSVDEDEDASGGLPLIQKFSQLQFKLDNQFTGFLGLHMDFPIYPLGPTSWCYSILGYNLINGSGSPNVPVLFFNTASAGQAVSSWQHVDGSNNVTSGVPYTRFRNTLRNFGSILGARGVLWHQGENDNTNGTSTTNYVADLTTVINSSRNFLANVPWFVSKVSYNPYNGLGLTDANVIAAQTNMVNPSNNIFAGISTDDQTFDGSQGFNFTRRGATLQLHFHAEEHKTIGERWFATQPWQGTSVQGTTLLRMDIQDIGSSYRLTVSNPPTGANYYWVKNNDGIDHALGTQSYFDVPKTSANVDFYSCYVSTDANGNVPDNVTKLQTTHPFVVPNSQDGLIALRLNQQENAVDLQFDSSPTSSQTVTINSSNVVWQVNNSVSWLHFNNLQGSFGDTPISIQADPNTSATARNTTIIVNQQNGSLSRTINLTQAGAGSSCQVYLSNLTPTYLYQPDYGGSTYHADQSVGGNSITIGGNTYSKGVGTHAYSDIKFNLAGQYQTFQVYVGRDDEADGCGACGTGQTVVFKVKLDGNLIYTSPNMGISTSAEFVNLPVSGKNELELIVQDGGDNIYGDHADWADAKLLCTTSPCGNYLTLTSPTDDYNSSTTKRAIISINASNKITAGNTAYKAGNSITLQAGFTASNVAVFKAIIPTDPCNN